MAVLVAILGGCSHPPKLREGWAMVYGTVTYQDKPLPAGEVMWCIAKDGASIVRGAAIRENGSFALDTPIGPAKIAIHVADVKKNNPSRYVEIPAKYTDAEQSGLTYEAKAGENRDIHFDLK